MPVLSLLLTSTLALWSCRVSPDDFARTPTLPPVETPSSTPPPAGNASEERLYQLLYAGELGSEARALGQRARMLAWLATMDFSEGQLAALSKLVWALRALNEDDRVATAAVGAREAALYGPIYADLAALYATATVVPEAALAEHAARLAEARAQVAAEGDPHAAQLARTKALLERVRPWVRGLPEAQRHRLSQCRFFLNHRLGPLLNPEDYGEYTGIDWDGGDFSQLRATARASDEPHMNVGGLWTTEAIRAPPGSYVDELQLLAIVTLALSEPGLPEAIEVRQGRRQPTDLAPAVAPAEAPAGD